MHYLSRSCSVSSRTAVSYTCASAGVTHWCSAGNSSTPCSRAIAACTIGSARCNKRSGCVLTPPVAQLRTVTRGKQQIHTKLRIGIGDGDLLRDAVLLIYLLIGPVPAVPQPLHINVISLQRQHTRMQATVRRKQRISPIADPLWTACRRVHCRVSHPIWSRIEPQHVRRPTPASIPRQPYRCTNNQKAPSHSRQAAQCRRQSDTRNITANSKRPQSFDCGLSCWH